MHRILLPITLLCLSMATARAQDAPPEHQPGADPAIRGKVCAWKSADGLAYRYFVPKGYDPEKGAGLTLVLHGSNLDRRWGFANHKAGEFRPDDVVVCPDGTTSNERGGFNSLQGKKDLERLAALHDELKSAFKVNATYLYGHSQGSFFALYFAGAYPARVQGVVAHASGVWIGTQMTRRHHGQAIVLMHGTQDPVVPYGQSVGAEAEYRKAKYPMLRLRSLEGWNHWPAEHNSPIRHTSQQLAWVEGMTSKSPARIARCFELLAQAKPRDWHDYAALYTLARRVARHKKLPGLRARATAAAGAVQTLATRHVAALMQQRIGKGGLDAPWVGHLPIFLRTFAGVPARDALAKKLRRLLAAHDAAAKAQLKIYWAASRKNDVKTAFAAGVQAIRVGPTHYDCADRAFLDRLDKWAGEAKQHGLDRASLALHGKLVTAFRKGLVDGSKAFARLNKDLPKY